MKLEVVHETSDPVEADALRKLLEEAGIPCGEVNESRGSIFGPTPDSASRLLVGETHADEARKLIRDFLAG